MTKYLTEERFIVHSNTKEAMKNYADNYDRIFRSEPEAPKLEEAKTEPDAIEMRFVTITHYCKVCEAMVPDPENHQHHGVITIDEDEGGKP